MYNRKKIQKDEVYTAYLLKGCCFGCDCGQGESKLVGPRVQHVGTKFNIFS